LTFSPKTEGLSALYRNCLFRSDARVSVHDQVSRELIDHVLRWKRGAPDAAMFKAKVNQLKMYVLQYGAEVEVTPRPFDDFAVVHTSLVGGAEIECDGHRLEVAEGRSAVIAPRKQLRLRWHQGTQQLIVKVPHALLRSASGLQDDEAIGLASGFVIPRGQSSQWDLLARSLLNVRAIPREAALDTAWLDHFEHNAALFLLAHQHAALQPVNGVASTPADVLATEAGKTRLDALIDYMDSRLGAPITLADLARVAGVSARSLNELCRRQGGVTPMELLRNRRLDAVRSRLRLHPEISVTEAALAFGFGHLGRFAHYYRERFRELPHQTRAKVAD
jgi:AraC-like DNA-binding protein